MLLPFARPIALFLCLAGLAVAGVARADVLPPPERPAWGQEPPPLPAPPPEKDLERAALVALAGMVLASAAGRWAIRARAERRA
jgi:hypothetical protein